EAINTPLQKQKMGLKPIHSPTGAAHRTTVTDMSCATPPDNKKPHKGAPAYYCWRLRPRPRLSDPQKRNPGSCELGGDFKYSPCRRQVNTTSPFAARDIDARWRFCFLLFLLHKLHHPALLFNLALGE